MTGETVAGFTSRVRNERAARLLKFSAKPIADIAMECGFSSPSTLSRLFRQYFHLSPAQYRRTGQIENSKIRKALVEPKVYHCDPDAEAMAQMFPVHVRQFPERRIAYIRVVDAFREGVVVEAFGELIKWAKTVGVFETGTIFGMSMDDPDVTPKEKYRYEVCIIIPGELSIPDDRPVQTMLLPACKYAVTTVSGNFDKVVAATNFLFDQWLINSAYECEAQHGLEVFRDRSIVTDWSHFELDLCIPVKALTNGTSG